GKIPPQFVPVMIYYPQLGDVVGVAAGCAARGPKTVDNGYVEQCPRWIGGLFVVQQLGPPGLDLPPSIMPPRLEIANIWAAGSSISA
ncbi:hypothetical protein, partial [Bradyrhizobium tunisiense]|uniref:hypothetical protein n=1 Tax=Bradyrhizobium tunisiense TaxID=3278709 RepID=UPI0035E249B5